MRLTGVDNGPLAVELYVFGPARAQARHFKVDRCARPDYPKPGESWTHWMPRTVSVKHPLLRNWTEGLPVATKLVATLSPADMRQDVWLDWIAFSEKGNVIFSRSGASSIALNWGAGVLGVGLLATAWGMAVARPDARRWSLQKLAAVVAILGILVTSAIYPALPKTEVRLVKNPTARAQSILYQISWELMDGFGRTNAAGSHSELSRKAHDVITVAETNAPYWKEWVDTTDWYHWQNYFLSGPVHEEDSPGNFTFRKAGDRFEFVAYDAQGAPNVLGSVSAK